VEVANRFRKATVFGLDLSPIHRNDAPANCHFVTGDLNQGLKFDSDSMDLVNSRLYAYILHLIVRWIRAGLTKEQWPKHIKEVYRVIKSGTGWVQAAEIDPRMRCDDDSCPKTSSVFKVWNAFRGLSSLLSVSGVPGAQATTRQSLLNWRISRRRDQRCRVRRRPSQIPEIVYWHLGLWSVLAYLGELTLRCKLTPRWTGSDQSFGWYHRSTCEALYWAERFSKRGRNGKIN